MTIAAVHHSVVSGNASGASSSSIDSTGVNLIVVGVATYSVGSNFPNTPTDNKGNTYTPLTASQTGSLDRYTRLYYCANPVVGTGHVISISGTTIYASMGVAMFSGGASSPFDKESVANGGADTQGAPGSLTPTEDGSVLVCSVCTTGSSHSINSGFTGLGRNNVGGTSMGLGFGYKIQTTKGAENPTWSWTTSSPRALAMGVFKPDAGVPALLFANAAYLTEQI